MSESKLVEGTNHADEYSIGVVQPWDKASGNFKTACDKANETTSVRKYLETDWKTRKIKTWKNWVESVIESIDGVWTKVQIYTNVFNNLIYISQESKITEQELFDTSVELRERMLHDLIAMNVDDLRNGEMAVEVTDIIDINHLKGTYGKVFADSMAKAMVNVIKELDIAITAGETAILGEPKKVEKLNIICQEMGNSIEIVLKKIDWMDTDTIKKLEEIKELLSETLEKSRKRRIKIMEEIEFNIGGTGAWINGGQEKFITLQPGQKVVMLQEQPTKNGIIGPRSNGITSIRNYMTTLAWEWRENLSFEKFLEKIGTEKAEKIPPRLKEECAWLQMWDISTGKTTVFNPFVSRVVLWWLESDPLVDISSQIHVTGNPWRKIKEGIKKGEENYGVNLDLDNVKIPQIIEILQYTCDIADDKAISSRNMWVPYALVCPETEVEKLLQTATLHWYTAKVIGEVTEEEGVQVHNVWIGKSSITL